MTLLANSLANYAGRFYVIATGILVLPLFLEFLGDEAYGLIGLFTLVQTMISLLNFGLSPTLGREAARSKAAPAGDQTFFKIIRSYELIFLCLCLVLAACTFFFSELLANNWLNIETLDPDKVSLAMILLCGAAIFRFAQSLYRSAIMGLEIQVWMNIADIIFATFRYFVALLIVIYVSNDIVVYFSYQLTISIIEFLVIRNKLFRALPTNHIPKLSFYKDAARPTFPFALGIAYTAGIWVLTTQTDKLILSGLLTLSEFGYYSLAAIVSGGIVQLSAPLSEALRPRLTLLVANNSIDYMRDLYRNGSQFVSLVTFSAAIIIAFNSKTLLFAWTGSNEASAWAAQPLLWLTLGNAILSVGAFQYYLQFAFGRLKLHVFGSTLSAVIQIPSLAYAALFHGAIGVAITWFIVRLVFFLFWVPIVHRKFVPGLHLRWLLLDICPIVFVAILSTLTFQSLFEIGYTDSRMNSVIYLIYQTLFVFVMTLCFGAHRVRKQIVNLRQNWGR